MAKPIEVQLVLNNKDVIRGAKDTEDALGKVSDSLDDLAKAGSKSADGLGDSLGDAGQSTDRLETKFRDLADSVKRNDQSATDSVKRDWTDASSHIELRSREGFRAASESTKAFKEEAVANFSETASSFQGDVQGIADGVQGTLGGLASSLPLPLGVGLGVLGGLFGTFFQGVQKQAEQTKQQVSSDFNDMVESGKKELSASFVLSQAQQLIDDQVPGQRSYADITKDAQFLGIAVSKVVLAYAGQKDAVDEVRKAIDKANKSQSTFTDETQFAQYKQQLGDITGQLDTVTSSITSAGSKAQVFDDVALNVKNASSEVKTLADRVDAIPEGKDIKVKVSADTKTADAQIRDLGKNKVVKVQLQAYTSRGKRVF